MSLAIRKSDGDAIEAVVSGKLTQNDYQTLIQAIGQRPEGQTPVRMLMELQDFTGWSIGGVWEEYRLSASQGAMVDRLAMVGPRMVNETQGAFDHPFVVNEVKYFAPEYLAEARAWLRSEQSGDGIGSNAPVTSQ